jgi:glucose dehydrogenase
MPHDKSPRVLAGLVALAMAALGACQPQKPKSTGMQTPGSGAPPGATAGTTGADDGQWVMPAKDYASTRYSALAEINAQTVGNLKVVGTFSTGVLRGH